MWEGSNQEYNASIFGNTIIIGKTGSGKTSLIQQWQKCGFLPDKKVYWVYSKDINDEFKKRNAKYFRNITYYKATNSTELADVLSQIQDVEKSAPFKNAVNSKDKSNLKSDFETQDPEASEKDESEEEQQADEEGQEVEEEGNGKVDSSFEKFCHGETEFGEKIEYTKTLILDDMSEIATKCPAFISYMTLSRKDNLSMIAIFHSFDKTDKVWDKILSNVDNICFLKLGSDKIIRYLGNNFSLCDKRTSYSPKTSSWLPRCYHEMVLMKEKGHHLLIHNGDTVPPGPGRYRLQTGFKPDMNTQFCCYPHDGGSKGSYKIYRARRCISSENKVENNSFTIDEIVGRTQAGENIEIKISSNQKRKLKVEDENFDSKKGFTEEEFKKSEKEENGYSWRANTGGGLSSKPKYLQR